MRLTPADLFYRLFSFLRRERPIALADQSHPHWRAYALFTALFRALQDLFQIDSIPRARYANPKRVTPTGKLRAKATPGNVERGAGPDYGILKDPALSKRAKKVYVYLSAIADTDGYCFPFYRTIAKRTNLSTSTVGKAIKELEQSGFLSHTQRVSRRGGSSNMYHINRTPHA